MRKICYLLIILLVFADCSRIKPANQTSILMEPLKTNQMDKAINNLIPNSNLTNWISRFDRKSLELNAKKILNKFIPKADVIIKEKNTLLPLSYCGIYAVISSDHPDFEYLPEGANSIREIHGGEYFYILTIDIGFGINPIASIDTTVVIEAYKESIVLDNQLIGDIRWWKIPTQTGNTFKYQNTPSDDNKKALQVNLIIYRN